MRYGTLGNSGAVVATYALGTKRGAFIADSSRQRWPNGRVVGPSSRGNAYYGGAAVES